MSNFSFSRSVFKRLALQTYKNKGMFEKWLSNHQLPDRQQQKMELNIDIWKLLLP